MAVENERIIQKMINELQQAKNEQNNRAIMKRHLTKVQALCELILEEDLPTDSKSDVTDQEMRAMIGAEQTRINNAKQQQFEQLSKPFIDEEKENSDSLFDF